MVEVEEVILCAEVTAPAGRYTVSYMHTVVCTKLYYTSMSNHFCRETDLFPFQPPLRHKLVEAKKFFLPYRLKSSGKSCVSGHQYTQAFFFTHRISFLAVGELMRCCPWQNSARLPIISPPLNGHPEWSNRIDLSWDLCCLISGFSWWISVTLSWLQRYSLKDLQF